MTRPPITSAEFLTKLQSEAALQARLSTTRIFPPQLDYVTSYIGRYAWQVLATLAGLTSLGLEAFKWFSS